MKVLALDSECFEANFMMANLMMSFESYCTAQEYYLKAMESNQELSKLYYNYGVLMANYLDDYETALQSYRKAVSIQEDFPHAWYNMGNIYARNVEDFSQARKCYETCISQSSSAIPEAYYNLGRILLSEFDEPEDKLKAKVCFETVIRLRPRYESAIYHYGKLLQDFLGDKALAKVQFLKVLKLNPDHWRAEQRLRMIEMQEIECANKNKRFVDVELEKSKSLILGETEFDESMRTSVKTSISVSVTEEYNESEPVEEGEDEIEIINALDE